MISQIRKELIIFGILLIVLTLLMHPDMLSNPLERFEMMSRRANFAHPLLYTGVLYFITVVIRILGNTLVKFFKKDEKKQR